MRLSVFSHASSPHPSAPTPRPIDELEEIPAAGNVIQTLADLRLQILNRLFYVALILGLIVYVSNLFVSPPTRENLIPLAVYTLLLALVTIAAINRKLSLNLRQVILLLAMLGVAVNALLENGLFGSGRIYLIVLPFLAAIFSGKLGRYLALFVSIGTLITIGIAMVFGWIPAPILPPNLGNDKPLSWIVATANFSLLAVAGALSYGVILDGLNRALEQQQTLSYALEKERQSLEVTVKERTRDLERRLVQIRTAAEITRAISRVLDLDALLSQVCELVRERFNLYYVGIFLIEPGRLGDEAANYAVLKAGTGEAGRAMLAEGHRLAVGGNSMIGWATAHRQPRIALDVGAEAVRFNNPHLPLTRSELALPILSRPFEAGGEARLLGAMTVQSTQEAAFDQDDIIVLQGVADALASAIENARLFASTQESLDEVRRLHRQYLESAWAQLLEHTSDLEYTYERSPALAEKDIEQQKGTLEIPLVLRDQVIGVLTLERDPSEADRPWTAEEQALAANVAAQAAQALESTRLLQETIRLAQAERTATAIASRLWTTSDVESIVRTALRELSTALNAYEASIELWPEEPSLPNPGLHSGGDLEVANA